MGATLLMAGPAAAASPHESASGSAKNRLAEFTPLPFHLAVSAHRRSPTEVSGHVNGSGDLGFGDFKVHGHVTCLRVEPKLEGGGLRASIKYRFDKTSGSAAPPENGGVEVYIEDNDEGPDGNGTGPPMDETAFEASDPESCSDPNLPPAQPYNPVDSGNYVLRDGN